MRVLLRCLLAAQLITSLAAAELSPLGQVVGEATTIDGVAALSGATLLDQSQLETTSNPARIHLEDGRLLLLDANSSIFLQRTSEAIEIRVDAGSLHYRNGEGLLVELGPGTTLQQQRTGPVDPDIGQGQVATLLELARSGEEVLHVDSTRRVLATSAVLIRSLDNQTAGIYYIRSVGSSVIRLNSRLQNTFEAGSLVFQGEPLDRALADGIPVIGEPMGASSGLGTGAIVGIILGIGAAAGAAAGLAGGGGDSSPPATRITP